jgi:hypothetical protein
LKIEKIQHKKQNKQILAYCLLFIHIKNQNRRNHNQLHRKSYLRPTAHRLPLQAARPLIPARIYSSSAALAALPVVGNRSPAAADTHTLAEAEAVADIHIPEAVADIHIPEAAGIRILRALKDALRAAADNSHFPQV